MDAKYEEITLGENICLKIKHIYFKDEAWPTVCHKVADKFTELKKRLRKFYGFNDWKDNVELLKKIRNYTESDIKDVLEIDYIARK